jgi:hypothetical protein
MELSQAFVAYLREHYPIHAPAQGKIFKVSESDGVCSVSFADGRPVNDRVTLQSILNPDILIIPADGSEVIVGYMDNSLNRSFLMKVARVKKVIWHTSPDKAMNIEMSDEGITIENNKGRFVLSDEGINIGQGTEPMVKGQSLSTWCAAVDAALAAIIAWGATGVAPGSTGGIVPLAGVQPTAFNQNILSQENKVS